MKVIVFLAKKACQILRLSFQRLGANHTTRLLSFLGDEFDSASFLACDTKHGRIEFYCPGKIPEWRARTMLSKEPETIAWIDAFSECDVFWDVGANIGCFSLYAALRNLKVLAFEPSPSNYYLLMRNIEVNRMDEAISAYCIALNDSTQLGQLFMSNTAPGTAHSSFAEPIDQQGNPLSVSLKQAMVGYGIDEFIEQFDPPFPNHIKIDVDGIENRIIKGACKTLADERVRSVLVELDEHRPDHRDTMAMLEEAGLRLTKMAQPPGFAQTDFAGQYNFIFGKHSQGKREFAG